MPDVKVLTLLRHAKSSWKDISLQDHERPLNHRGQQDALIMAERIKRTGNQPSLILSSPAVRAWTTAKIVSRAIGYPVAFLQQENRLNHASVRSLVQLVAEQDTGFNNIMIISHNPGLTDFANYLLPNLTDNIPTCGFVSIEINHEDWNLDGNIEAKLIVYDYPKRVEKG